MQSKVLSKDGKELKKIELADAIFNAPINDDVIYYAINNELANARVGTACTKGRAEVHGSNARPFKQKGTGRARQGDKKSPLQVGGGIIFGPKPRDYSYRMNKKAKRLAMKSILSMKAQDGSLKIIEDFKVESGKTKDLVAALANVIPQERAVLVMADDDELIKRAARNLPWLKYLSFKRLRAHDLYYGKHVVMLESAASGLCEFYKGK